MFDIKFECKVFQAVYISGKQEFVVIADNRETGPNNLFIYDSFGKVIANPEMPEMDTKVDGVYSMWYVEGSNEQTLILLTPERTHYETKCTFSLSGHSFSDFSATR